MLLLKCRLHSVLKTNASRVPDWVRVCPKDWMRGPGCFLGITVIALWLSLQPALGFLWKEWCWSWNSSTLATSCEELTHWKRLWCWEGLGAGGERDNRGWDGWMASLTRWTWVWVNSGSWWWTGRPGLLRFTGSQRVGHDWANELNWTELTACLLPSNSPYPVPSPLSPCPIVGMIFLKL